jgi:hypothetical protein
MGFLGWMASAGAQTITEYSIPTSGYPPHHRKA